MRERKTRLSAAHFTAVTQPGVEEGGPQRTVQFFRKARRGVSPPI